MRSITLSWLLVPLLATSAAVAGEVKPFTDLQYNHWAWKPAVRPLVPQVRDGAWVRNPIDAFVLTKLEARGIAPATPAGREQLLRRVTLDLIGLPPTPAEIDAFVVDPAPNAYEKVIDRLLASPQYGERWGRHWLDLARFAESNGYEHDEVRPNAWRYRDYVVRSYNADQPYDRFILEQLAGDEIIPDDPDAAAATGFNLLGPDMTDASDQVQRRQNTLNDMTDTTALAFLGLTLGCARCHDHKFEPLPQTDYYRLQAFFTPAGFRTDIPVATREQRAAHAASLLRYEDLVKPLRAEIAKLEAPYRQQIFEKKLAKLAEDVQTAHRTPAEQRTPAQQTLVDKTLRFLGVTSAEMLRALSPTDRPRHEQLRAAIKKFDSRKPAPLPAAMGLRDDLQRSSRTFLLERGELSNRGEEVQAGFPVIVSPGFHEMPVSIVPPRADTTGRRAALARWIADADNPLTARVMVNRLWQHHFGRGIVRSASDFGIRGEGPTHPELLDWLATEFVAQGWSVKAMHRLMLVSATYRQSSAASRQALARDSDNELFSRMNRLRLEAEVIRDSLLALGQQLNPKMGGPGVFPPMPAEAVKGTKGWTVSADTREHGRRSLYIFAGRNLRLPFLEVFDLPDNSLSCPIRGRSTTAPQALGLLNAEEVVNASQLLAARLAREEATEIGRITRAYQLTLGRRPSVQEMESARAFLTQSPLSELCRALFNINEFVYVD